MYTSVSSLIENKKISYADLQEMIKAGLIKNLFILTGEGVFTPIDKIGTLEDRYLQYKNTMLESEIAFVKDAKDTFISMHKEYRYQYRDLKRRHWNYDKDFQIKVCGEKLKEIMKRDQYTYDINLRNWKTAKRKYDEEARRLDLNKNKIIYDNVFILEVEYSNAKREYVKKFVGIQ